MDFVRLQLNKAINRSVVEVDDFQVTMPGDNWIINDHCNLLNYYKKHKLILFVLKITPGIQM